MRETQLHETLLQALKDFQFEKAEMLLEQNVSPQELTRTLHRVIEKGAGILAYTFVNHMIARHQTAFWHRVAAFVIAESLEHIEQGNNAGLYHILEAIKLAPEDWLLKEYALSFYDGGILGEELAKELANAILEKEPFNKLAIKVIENKPE